MWLKVDRPLMYRVDTAGDKFIIVGSTSSPHFGVIRPGEGTATPQPPSERAAEQKQRSSKKSPVSVPDASRSFGEPAERDRQDACAPMQNGALRAPLATKAVSTDGADEAAVHKQKKRKQKAAHGRDAGTELQQDSSARGAVGAVNAARAEEGGGRVAVQMQSQKKKKKRKRVAGKDVWPESPTAAQAAAGIEAQLQSLEEHVRKGALQEGGGKKQKKHKESSVSDNADGGTGHAAGNSGDAEGRPQGAAGGEKKRKQSKGGGGAVDATSMQLHGGGGALEAGLKKKKKKKKERDEKLGVRQSLPVA